MAKSSASKDTSSEQELLAEEMQADEQVLEDLLDDTHKILKQAVDRAGPKRVARALDVSLSLVYKWTQPPRTKKNPAASGARNPLDKLVTIFHLSEDIEVIQFLCRIARGYYTSNPMLQGKVGHSFVTATVGALNEFADLMQLAEKSLTDDGRIDESEAKNLRKDWDRLKGRLEHFIVACEEGAYDIEKTDKESNGKKRGKAEEEE
ncbi:MAG: hypothetical protein KDB68_06665 [Planctomycetes bacterium]|nr:hypothetical protein [Planctomycetota bacterium]